MADLVHAGASRKRKRPSSSNSQLVPDKHHLSDPKIISTRSASLKSRGNVRQLLVDLRSGELAKRDVSTRILALNEKEFPRQDEYTLNYLLGQCHPQGQDQATADLGFVWHHICRLINNMSPDRLVSALRKVDFLRLFQNYLSDENATKSDDGSNSLQALRRLFSSRVLRKVLLTTLDRSYATLLALLRLDTLDSVVKEDTISILTDILLFCTKNKYSQKKLQETILSLGFKDVTRQLQNDYHSLGLRRLLLASVFSEASLLDSKETERVIKSLDPEADMYAICQISFEAANTSIKNVSTRLETRNILLGHWLRRSPVQKRPTVLAIYQATRTDLQASRPLSADKTLAPLLSTCVEDALNLDVPDVLFINQLLDIDLDVILPKYSDQIWNLVPNALDSPLALRWLQAHIEVRAFADFISRLINHTLDTDVVLSAQFMNVIATEVSKATESSQHSLLGTVLVANSHIQAQVLTSIIGGLTRNTSTITTNIDQLLKCRDDSGDLQRTILLKLAESHIPSHVAPTLSLLGIQPISSIADAEAWLRALELGVQVSDADSEKRISDVLNLCTNAGALTRAIVIRWLPVVTIRMNVDQKARLIDILFASVQDEDDYQQCILSHPNLLESEDLHNILQQRLVDMSQAQTRAILQYIPVEFFHKAVRRQLLSRMIGLATYDDAIIQTLLKFAHADLIPKFDSAQDYATFASFKFTETEGPPIESNLNSNATSSLPIHAFNQLKAVYMRSLAEDICKAIVLDSEKPLVLRLELFEELSRRESCDCTQLWDILARRALQGLQVEDHINDSLSTPNIRILVRLFRAINMNNTRESLGNLEESGASTKGLVCEIRDWQEPLKVDCQGADSSSLIELKAWCSRTAIEALIAFQAAISSKQGNQLYDDSQALVAAVRMTLSSADFTNLLILMRQNTETQVIEQSTSWRAMTAAMLIELSIGPERPSDSVDGHWLADEFLKTCLTIRNSGSVNDIQVLQIELRFLQSMFTSHSRVLTIRHLDDAYAMVVELAPNTHEPTILLALYKLLRSSFEQHAHLLRDRYHLVVYVFQTLITSKQSKVTAESLVRLFDTFLHSSRTLYATPEVFNRAFSKHVPWLLIEYINAVVSTSVSYPQMIGEVKTVIEEGLIYEIMGLCGTHEREMIGASLTSSGRGLFKKLYDEWSRFGKWVEK